MVQSRRSMVLHLSRLVREGNIPIMRKKEVTMKYKSILASALLLFASSAHAVSGTEYLNHFMNKVKSLKAVFTQEVVSDQGKITQTSYGAFRLLRPGRFFWEYESPAPQKIISDGKNMWIYDIELEQVTVKPLSQALGASPAAILTNPKSLSKRYTVLEKPPREGLQWVELLPKDKQGDFLKVEVGLDDAGVQAMDLYDQFGQLTVIRFRESEYGVPLSPSIFQFVPPKGVDVIGKPR
ncbi:MAG TPA: outer membrane lipoprotein chaperone LolA [Gammaproteobacteria bacterium]|nr:outer membrane lipoprotein chaperone LolA [Gammaproteobacteria bacterium]